MTDSTIPTPFNRFILSCNIANEMKTTTSELTTLKTGKLIEPGMIINAATNAKQVTALSEPNANPHHTSMGSGLFLLLLRSSGVDATNEDAKIIE